MNGFRKVLILLFLVFSAIGMVAQEPKWKELQKESDGFRWYKYTYEKNSNDEYPIAAFDLKGKRLTCTTEHLVSYRYGFFEVWTRNDANNNHVHSIYDKHGNCIIPDGFGFSSISIYPEHKLFHCSNSMVIDGKYLFTMDGKYYADANSVFWTKTGEFQKAEKLPVSQLANQYLASNPDSHRQKTNDAKDNNVINTLKYDEVSPIELNGKQYYSVKNNGKKGLCDMKGNEIIPPKYDDVFQVKNEEKQYYIVKLNGKEGVCDSNGMEIIAPRYDDVVCLKNEGHYYYSVELKGKEGVCDISGNEIIPPKYKTLFYSSSDRVFMYENRSGNDVSTGIALDENGIGYKLSPSESKQVAQKKAKKERKKIDFGELLGIIADGLEDISETLEESNKMLQSLDPNNYNTPQNTYNSSFESSNNNNNYVNNDEERKKKDEEYKQRKEERDNKAKQMEWWGKHGPTYTNLYMKWYEIIQDVKGKTITVKNWEPEYRLSQLKTAQSKCKEIAKLYKEKTGSEIPCPKNDLDWVPSAKDLVGN